MWKNYYFSKVLEINGEYEILQNKRIYFFYFVFPVMVDNPSNGPFKFFNALF